jgi:hypothetical protein
MLFADIKGSMELSRTSTPRKPAPSFGRIGMITSLRGELRLKLGPSELAETGFHEAIALAQKAKVKA